MDVAPTEAVKAELTRMIEKRSRKGEVDPDELEPSSAKGTLLRGLTISPALPGL